MKTMTVDTVGRYGSMMEKVFGESVDICEDLW